MLDPVQQFREAMQARGLVPPFEVLADGEIHRCNAEERGGENDGAYLLHLDGVPAGGLRTGGTVPGGRIGGRILAEPCSREKKLLTEPIARP